MKLKIVWVAGGRYNKNAARHENFLMEYVTEGYVLIVGGATGTDAIAEKFWKRMQRPYIVVPAEWNRYQKMAGPKRNFVIADYEPEVLVAFPGDRGTFHAVQVARERDIEVIQVPLR